VLHVRQQRQLVGVLAVALEEPGLRLADVEDVEERGVREQLDVVVRARRRRGHEPVARGALVEAHELPERLDAAEAAEDRGLVEADDVERARVELPVADRLVVRQVDPVGRGLRRGADEARLEPEQATVAHELLADPERADDQAAAAAEPVEDEPLDLELLHRLPKPERLEQRPPAAADSPHDGVALVRLQDRVDLAGSTSNPSCGATAALPRRKSA
jgi:hypothetical protein